MNYNYHTHTYRCSHASGSIEEYILRAIECGMEHMGFSDHMPYICSDGYESSYRVPVAEGKDYIAEVALLREKYKDKIDIKIGFEMEYYPSRFEGMLKNAIEFGAEYLILGQHYNDEEHPGGIHINKPTDSVDGLKEYVACVVMAIKSGVFTYIAHPDMINFTGERAVFQQEIRRICIASRENNVPLELNFLGIWDNRNYPNEAFWEIAGREKAPVTFGFDAHDVQRACDQASLKRAEELVEKYNLNYIGKPKVILLQRKG